MIMGSQIIEIVLKVNNRIDMLSNLAQYIPSMCPKSVKTGAAASPLFLRKRSREGIRAFGDILGMPRMKTYLFARKARVNFFSLGDDENLLVAANRRIFH